MNSCHRESDSFRLLKYLNPKLEILSVTSSGFSDFGSVHSDFSAAPLLETALQEFSSTEGTSYLASSPELEACSVVREAGDLVFGEAAIQAGCCWGNNSRMNGMEFHKSSELLGAATDLLLILGRVQDIDKDRWDSALARFFYIPAGTMVELYATTLHLAPCRVDESPFCAVIILPRGTNTPLDNEAEGTLWMKNKWLLTHKNGPAAGRGAWIGIEGENWEIRT